LIPNCDLIVSLGQVNREIERFFTKKGITPFANADMLFGTKFETILSIGMVRDRRFYDNSFIVISFSKDKLLWFNLSGRSEEHTSELQSRENLVCRLLLEKKNRRRPKSSNK